MLDEKIKESFRMALFFDFQVPAKVNYDPWILEPLVPYQAITILDGLGGSGKSWLALDITYSISLGRDFLGMFPVRRPGTVLYLTAEEVPEMFFQRINMMRKHYPVSDKFLWVSLLDRNIEISPYICKKIRGDRTIAAMAEVLEWLISTDKERPVLVILDSLINFFGLDENSSEDAMFFYDVLKSLIRKYKTSFLLLHHQNKEGMRSQGDDVISFRGSGVLREQARSRIIYKNVKFEEGTIARKIILEKSNYYSKLRDLVPEEGLYLKFDSGAHIYDRDFAEHAKKLEAEAKQKGRKKESNKNNGKQTYTRADL